MNDQTMSSLKRIVFRGDQEAYTRRGDRFPYIDHAVEAGATGVHVWFWKEPFLAVKDDFFSYCRERDVAVHLGIGVGAYGVCEGEDPTDPQVRERIKDHVSRVVDQFPIAGIELQNGEYDEFQYRGPSAEGKTRARQVAEQLNPIVDHALRENSDLWVRTELNAKYFPEAEVTEIARELDPRCSVEWSAFTGPYRGADAFERGRALLERRTNSSWFLKIAYNSQLYWNEVAADTSSAQIRKWVEHWRGWVKLLRDAGRTTLTICNVDAGYVDGALPVPAAAVSLAMDPDVPTAEVLEGFFT